MTFVPPIDAAAERLNELAIAASLLDETRAFACCAVLGCVPDDFDGLMLAAGQKASEARRIIGGEAP